MGKFLKFEKIITPIFVQLIFWIGFVLIVLSGLGGIGYGVISSNGGFIEIGSGLLMLVIGPIVLRIYCELLIVVFKIQGSLIEIRDDSRERTNISSTGNVEGNQENGLAPTE